VKGQEPGRFVQHLISPGFTLCAPVSPVVKGFTGLWHLRDTVEVWRNCGTV
jgi:hypothetical protein